MSRKILHIAPQNFAGMPLDFVKMHRSTGTESRLITLYKNTINFEEDICLGFKLPTGKRARMWRDSKIGLSSTELKYNKPKNIAEKFFFKFRDISNSPVLKNIIDKYDLFSYDIYHFDGGMDLYRDLRFAREIKKRGKKMVCCYYGSDLRTRGVFRELDEMSDLNLTVEFDHLSIHKNINYIFFPFDVTEYEIRKKNNKKIKIIHSPTNRKFKGTDKILEVINEIDKQRQIEFILIENMDRNKVLEIKSDCDLAIDQVGGEMGGTGYGKNSIENLSMGIPTFTEFTDDYLTFIRENPFVHSTIDTLGENIIRLIDNEILRNEISISGRLWVEKYHSFESVNGMLQEYYKTNNILQGGEQISH
ncbi:MAG TPA: hypothetical protein PKC91_03955 [Ignavibacteria bacterium]|nr:hypothetical protein [Ignavibacteria bacterium]